MKSIRSFGVLGFFALLSTVPAISVLLGGDSLVGRVSAVNAANVITIDHGTGTYDIRISGVELAEDEGVRRDALQAMSELLLGKMVRMAFDGRGPEGTMYGRVWIFNAERQDGPPTDVGVELVRRGLARGYDDGYKYNEMSRAEEEARGAQRGLWRPRR